MPKRPKQHQLEDYSINQFKQLLPEKWIVREKGKDYGVDLEVEIVDKNDNPTGEVFLVQMKATESKSKQIIHSVSMKIDTLSYYRNFSLPILLVRYSKTSNQFFFRWVNNVDLYSSKKNAKTFNVIFNEKNIWDEKTIDKIQNHLKYFKILKGGLVQLPIDCSIHLKENLIKSEDKIVTESKIVTELMNNNGYINFISEEGQPLISIEISKELILINASDIYGCSFQTPIENSTGFVKQIFEFVLIGVAYVLHRVGQFELGAKILIENGTFNTVAKDPKLILYFLPDILRSSYLENLFEIIDKEAPPEIKTIARKLLYTHPEKESKKINLSIEKILTKTIDSEIALGNKTNLAVAYYNLGNFYKSYHRNLEALINYQKARKTDTIYCKQPYFWRELAGIFFTEKRFYFSASYYKKSLDMEMNTETLPLYADALMFSGEYKKALSVLEEYLQKEEKPFNEFILKYLILNNIIQNYKVESQRRNIVEAKKLAESESTFEKALNEDILCDLAWFNIGILLSNEKKNSEASFAFCTAALIENRDLEAWSNAASMAFASGKTEVFIHIIRTAYFIHREAFVQNLITLLAISKFPSEGLEEIKKLLYLSIKDIKEEKRPVAIRVLDNDGKFKDVFSDTKKLK